MRILYFAWVAERVGAREEIRPLPAGVTTVATLLDWLEGLSARHRDALTRRRVVRVAVNQEFAGPDHPVTDGDEVAIFPPVTGG